MAERARNHGWDAIVEVFGLNPETEAEIKRVGKVAAALNKKNCSVQLALKNKEKWKHMFPGATLTPEALVKHWNQLIAFKPPPEFPGLPTTKSFDRDQQYRCLELHGEEFLRKRCKNEGYRCVLDEDN